MNTSRPSYFSITECYIFFNAMHELTDNALDHTPCTCTGAVMYHLLHTASAMLVCFVG